MNPLEPIGGNHDMPRVAFGGLQMTTVVSWNFITSVRRKIKTLQLLRCCYTEQKNSLGGKFGPEELFSDAVTLPLFRLKHDPLQVW